MIEAHPIPEHADLVQAIQRIAMIFSLAPAQYHRVPHVTLYGTFDLREGADEQQVTAAIAGALATERPPRYTFDGWERRQTGGTWAIAFRIKPSRRLVAIRKRLLRALEPFTVPEYGRDVPGRPGRGEEVWFHCTLARNLSGEECNRIWRYLRNAEKQNALHRRLWRFILYRVLSRPRTTSLPVQPLRTTSAVLRVTLMRGFRIVRAYDLVHHRTLSRDEALNRPLWRRTLEEYQGR
ncbi:hypothetical protein AZH53_08135 [Methanomicrobiaceae archaeon CYW5]|uniref:2'-5' RNA ligase family protein n=1 Tax=Methanovulcanius yangii TaxID=1789227 RepID=UPI0029C9FCBD|nr:2'-5' RNA ligase family protein [Methanovulcanius yangii]MBT8508370.1 hypothetical protein [Methanovulcanius yangii]